VNPQLIHSAFLFICSTFTSTHDTGKTESVYGRGRSGFEAFRQTKKPQDNKRGHKMNKTFGAKNIVGIIFAMIISGAFMLGMSGQTGSQPQHWFAGDYRVPAGAHAQLAKADESSCKLSSTGIEKCPHMTVSAKRTVVAQRAPVVVAKNDKGANAGAIQLASSDAVAFAK
jgi:hypothetical protein